MMRFLVICMLVGILNTTLLAYSGGTGEPNDPYQIATAEDLNALGSEPNDYNDCFILTADIDLSGYVFDRAVIAPDTNDSFSGFQGPGFGGFFEGQGHVIVGLHIEGDNYLGLFGSCSSEATILNLGLESVDINGMGRLVGGLAGDNGGSVISSYSTGSVSGYDYVGGLVGYNQGNAIITSSYSSGLVRGYDLVGGLVGGNGGCITSSYNSGSVNGGAHVGGLVGENEGSRTSGYYANNGTITSSYSTGLVNGVGSVGGLVGRNHCGSITSSFWDIETSSQSTSAGGTGLTTTQMQDIITYLEAGWDFIDEMDNGTCNYWVIQEGSYPGLAVFSGILPIESNGSGTPDDPYLLTDANELGSVWTHPRACYRLETDIDLSGIAWNSAVVPGFGGVFDGNGHVISNLNIEGGGFLGLFGICYSGTVISNLGLETLDVNGVGNLVSGLVGCNSGSITSSYSTGSVCGIRDYVGGLVGVNSYGIIMSSYNTCAVGGTGYSLGGLVGENSYGGIITSSYSTGVVNGNDDVGGLVGRNHYGSITSSYSTGTVSGADYYVGGLVGNNVRGTVTSSYSTGAVSGTGYSVGGLVGNNFYNGSITSSYSTGKVSGNWHVGGLVGYSDGVIASSYSTGEVIGNYYVGGLVGAGNNSHSGITLSYSTSLVNGHWCVGGLVGENEGSISSCYSTGMVSGTGYYAGGLAGVNDGTITSSYSMGAVRGHCYVGGLVGVHSGGWNWGGSITSSYSTGAVNGNDSVGGLVGSNWSGNWWNTITSSFWDIETSGQSTSAGGTGLTTSQMQDINTLSDAGWDFVDETDNGTDDIWWMPVSDYPRLWWESSE